MPEKRRKFSPQFKAEAVQLVIESGRPVAEVARDLDSAQYTSIEFVKHCASIDVRPSVGRTGVCWDNAAAESFFASLKNEMYHHQRFATRAAARFAVADYIEIFYNRQRLHSSLGYRTPAEVLTDHHYPATAA